MTSVSGNGIAPVIELRTAAEHPLPQQIYLAIRERIIEGTLRPGERIRERELAEEFGVSRIPVREALPRLESEGYIASSPRRGVVVTELSYRDVVELFEVRSGLEVLAARLAARAVLDGAAPTALLEAMGRAVGAVESGDDALIATVNSDIHDAILRLSQNRLLESLMVPVGGRVRRLFRLEAERDQRVLCSEHRGLCDAIAGGHEELAAALAFAHVEHSRQESLALLHAALPPA